jgi:transposase
MKPNTSIVYVGVDVAKASLQVHLDGRQWQLCNTPAGQTQLARQLQAHTGAHVVCEATGGYEQGLVQKLQQNRIPVSVVNPAQVRAAARAQGLRAKTDPIDAAVLSDYGRRYEPAATPPLSPGQRQLAELMQWLSQLIQAQAVAKGQAEHHENAFVRRQHAQLLRHLESQIQKVEKQLEALLDQDPALQQRVLCLDAIQGVGPRTALSVMAHMPELGHLNRRQVGALAGLAPWTRESGQFKGRRFIGGGRPDLRLAVYMAALSACRHNPVLRPLYERLVAKGKPAKVALTAVMRRLLIYMNHQIKKLEASQKAPGSC